MTDDSYGATVAKRRLSRRLASLRVRAGMSVERGERQARLEPGSAEPVRGQPVAPARPQPHPGPGPDLRRQRR